MTRRDPIIMILDGKPESRESVRSILEAEGLRSQAGADISSSLESMDSTVGVVLLDLGLVEGEHADLISRLIDQRPGIRIIAMADESAMGRVLDALRDGACDYLAKPLHAEELTLSVRRAVGDQVLWADGAQLKQRLSLLGARVEALVARAGGQRGENRLALIREGIVTAVSEVLNVEKASLLLLDRDEDVLRVVAWSGRTLKPEEAEPLDLGDGVAGRVFKNSEAWLVEEASADPRVTSVDLEGRYRSASFVAAPVLCSGRSMGVLCATDRISGGEVFCPEDLAILRILAAQLGSLLEPLLLQDEIVPGDSAGVDLDVPDLLEEHEADPETGEFEVDVVSELAREICQAAIDEVEPERVIQGILQPLVHRLSAAPVSIFLVEAAGGSLALEGECDGGVAGDRDSLAPGKGLTGHVLRTGQLVATAEPDADPRFVAEIDTARDGRVRPLLCLPLTLRGRVVGVCRAFLGENRDPSVRTAEVIAPALSAALRNALLYRSLVEAIEDVAQARRAARS